MQKQTVKAILLARLSRPGDTTMDTIIDNEMDLVQKELEKGPGRYDFQLKQSTNISLLSGVATFSLPTDYIAMWEDTPVQTVDSNSNVVATLSRRPYEELKFKEDGIGETTKYYSIVDTTGYVFPVADRAYTLDFWYHATAPSFSGLTPTGENYWLREAPDFLINHVGLTVASLTLQNPQLVQLYSGLLQKATSRLEIKQGLLDQEKFDPGQERI